MSRPEHLAPPEIAEMSARAIELLALPDDEPKFLLDIGCGSGLSGEIIEEEGHYWVDLAVEKDLEGDLFLHDIGHGLGFRPGTFDGAISPILIHA
ncbi:putative 18S rRNA (guanine-N(7))-methyltransferase [Smittium culicis]|uniref:Putative 18S rRNA (Guanine-N(7))-methyltransferase n=1 Tax=Smittium culicis TaxID=133412 RepID=A0A1R1X9X1_9FUNG|nr:putative 18S rRNA (guanine-N(7))-methyltransferase [Smittium culicis]